MNTEQMTPTPPPGMRIILADELTKPLPMDAMVWAYWFDSWRASDASGGYADKTLTYATATPPPTDWRKLVEEFSDTLEQNLYAPIFGTRGSGEAAPLIGFRCTCCNNEATVDGDELKHGDDCWANRLLTRAEAAMEETK